MASSRLLVASMLGVLLGVAGCGDDPPPAPVAIQDLLRCDITLGPCQRAIYASVAESLDAEGFLMPSIRTISVEQHASEVRNGLPLEDLTGEDPVSRGLRLVGFIPEASDSLTGAQAEYFISQVAAYYSRNANTITIIDRDYDAVNAQTLLAHEFIHAIQNAQFDLNVVSSGADTEDGIVGVRSVIEGDAVYSSFAWAYENLGYAPDSIDWEAVLRESTEALREDTADPAVALIDTASSFPYAYGFEFMTVASLAGGLDARAAAFGAPPQTAAQVMTGYGVDAPPLSIPDAAHPAPLDGNEVEVSNRYGAWYVYAFLVRNGASDEDAWAAALSWVGDELAIYANGEEVVSVWRVRFEDAVNAAVLTERTNLGETSSARSAVTFGDDAFVFAAESSDTLLAWAEQPLDVTTASIVLKSGHPHGGAVSVGGCMQRRDFSLPHPVLRHP